MAELVPLFPLPLVLFPETPLPLHIFEPRYKEMIGECLSRRQPFGVLRATDDGFVRAGCTAEILEVTKKYEDGKMDIVTLGQKRFEVTHVDQQRAFLRGELSYFEDTPGESPSEQREQALALQRELIAMSGEQIEELPEEHPQLSFQLASAVPLPLDFKQTLLVMRSEPERLNALVAYYKALIPRLRRALKGRAKAGGNGHVVN